MKLRPKIAVGVVVWRPVYIHTAESIIGAPPEKLVHKNEDVFKRVSPSNLVVKKLQLLILDLPFGRCKINMQITVNFFGKILRPGRFIDCVAILSSGFMGIHLHNIQSTLQLLSPNLDEMIGC